MQVLCTKCMKIHVPSFAMRTGGNVDSKFFLSLLFDVKGFVVVAYKNNSEYI